MNHLVNTQHPGLNLLRWMLVLCCLVPRLAIAGCDLFVPTAINAVGVDGTESPNEWADANVVRSGEGCFTGFFDKAYSPPNSQPSPSQVKVYAKQTASHIFLRFDVQDSSGNPPPRTMPIVNDQIYVVVGPNPSLNSGRSTGTTGAKMIKVVNPRGPSWSSMTSPPMLRAGNGTGWGIWTLLPLGAGGYSVAITNLPSGYLMELAIPKPLPGSDTHNLGFAVLNDIGTADTVQSGYLDAFAANLPSALGLTAVGSAGQVDPDDPIPTGPSSTWANQQDWALTDSRVGAEVTISHVPQLGWLSDDIDVLRCDEDPNQQAPRVGDSYLYFGGMPCPLRVRVWLRNTASVTQHRSVLAVASTSGMGVGDWQVVGLGENVAIPSTGLPTSPAALVWHSGLVTPAAGMVNGAHPCVRVYILPAQLDQQTRDKFRPDARILDSDLHGTGGLVSRFGLDSSLGGSGSQVAQQNISVTASQSGCPTCRVGLAPADERRLAEEAPRALSPAPWRSTEASSIRLAAAGPVGLMVGVATGQAASVRDRLRENYGKDHVTIDVRGFAFDSAPPIAAPAYRIIEPIGGVTQLFRPKRKDILGASAPSVDALPTHFVVGNPSGRTRTFIVRAEVEYPPGYGQGLPKQIELPPFVLRPGETRLIESLPTRAANAPRMAVIVALGASLPNGSFGNSHDAGPSLSLGLEYIWSPTWSLEATLSGHRFKAQGAASDIDVTQVGLNAKWYLSTAPLRWFATTGVATYRFDPGRSRTGANVGVGVQYELTPQWSVEGRYGLHTVNGNAPNSRFSTATVGLRLAF